MTKRILMAFATVAALMGCGGEVEPVTPEPTETLAWMDAHAEDFMGDRAWRRDRLEETLWRPELPYAKKLLDNYGLERGGWDLLPVLDVEVAPVHGPLTGEFAGEPIMTSRPETREEWLALGERVFWQMPMRRDPYLEWVVANPQVWEEAGLTRREDGSLRGFVRYLDPRGRARVGITCGLCHGEGGDAGRADLDVDLGKARALYMEARGLDTAPFDAWGPGRVDVTDDGVVDPTKIPNLWGASEQSHFNASGVIKVASPASAAVRFETQYIINHAFEARPDRALPWALAMFVMSLEAPTPDAAPTARGEELFAQRCAGCHDPARGYSGDLIAASALTSDPLVSNSPMRGTGSYRVPSLLGVSQGGPFLHDLSAPTLGDLLDEGHPSGAELTPAEREDLLSFLNTL
jgi:mono/diheme cytochrome c family protein